MECSADKSGIENYARVDQLSWLGTIAAEGGLFVMIGRRNAGEVGVGRG